MSWPSARDSRCLGEQTRQSDGRGHWLRVLLISLERGSVFRGSDSRGRMRRSASSFLLALPRCSRTTMAGPTATTWTSAASGCSKSICPISGNPSLATNRSIVSAEWNICSSLFPLLRPARCKSSPRKLHFRRGDSESDRRALFRCSMLYRLPRNF